MKLNETPVRTARNFNINNIKLENIEIPDNIELFNNFDIKTDLSKNEITKEIINEKIVYGLNEDLTKLAQEKSNAVINIKINSKTNKDIYIDFNFDEYNLNLIENISIVAEENTKSTIYIKYQTRRHIKAFHNGIINVVAKKNSIININYINLLNCKSNNFMTIQNKMEENAELNFNIVDFGGKNSITNYFSDLRGDLSKNKLNTIYLGKDEQIFDLNYIGELRGKKSDINIEVQGALKDNAKKHFKGTIDFKKGCKKAIGNENENCMLLSNRAKSIALPMLLCSEEDIEGNHSCSAGKIGEKELFYIMSRGFNKKEAQKLMVIANFNKILKNIKNEELRELILHKINKRID